MTRVFNTYHAFKAWVVAHAENFYFAFVMPIIGYFAPIKNILILALAIIAVDFITGILAARKRGEGIESKKLYKSFYKLCCVYILLMLIYAIDTEIPVISIHKIAAWIIIGFELWSILENMAQLTDHPLFSFLKRFMKGKIENVSGLKISDDESLSRENNK